MNTSQYREWTPPCPVQGMYDLKVNFAENFRGSNPDDNGEVSVGMKFRYDIVGPHDAVLDNGESAIGFQFEELLLEPKQSSSPKYKEMCMRKWNAQLKSIFGDMVPDNVSPEDFFDKIFTASAKPKWSDFNQANVPELGFRKAYSAE